MNTQDASNFGPGTDLYAALDTDEHADTSDNEQFFRDSYSITGVTAIDNDTELPLADSDTTIAGILAESFYEGWVPADLEPDFLAALELSSCWEPTLRELHSLARTWDSRQIDRQAALNQLEGLKYTLQISYDQTLAVSTPAHAALYNLLCALQESFHALVESCNAFAAALDHYVDSGVADALASADMAGHILHNIYAGTHFSVPEAE